MVCGVGNCDIKCVDENGKVLKSYYVWKDMIKRCYNEKVQEKQQTYVGCSVCSEWLLYSNFKKFFDNNYKEGTHLDKDILIRGNILYSEQTCRFVPQYINKLLLNRGAARGEYKLGVYYSKKDGKFISQCCAGIVKSIYLGSFNSEQDAFSTYKSFKENHIKEISKKAYDNNEIGLDIYNALQNWTIE